MSMYVNEGFLRALKLHFESEIKKYQATLDLFLSNPTAVADHTTLMDDMKELTKQLAEAEDALNTLNDHYPIKGTQGKRIIEE